MTRFKDEVAGHKEDFVQVLNQLKDDARKSMELRKSAELREMEARAIAAQTNMLLS